MHRDTLAKGFKKIEQPTDVSVGAKLVWEYYSSDDNYLLYWATVTKVTPKTIVVECKDAPSHKQRDMTFYMRRIYGNSGPEELEGRGDATGSLYSAANDDAIAIVQAAYAHRADAKAAEEERKRIQDQERQERIASERAQAAADNPSVEWSQFTACGSSTYYHGFVRSRSGDVVLAVVAVAKCKNDSWHDEELKAHPFIWKAAVNYDRNDRNVKEYGPSTMGGFSSVGAYTLEQLFQEVIYRIWS